ncbi:thiamine ABC transporter permease [Weissella oryzae SG25]|uniref:UvrABC system protein A n=1 Tax=Weissella oryzae (strain DSM 25784 / JCM 18191 / LMG 30913 / SG25) TaxID=1329250 RepID=A0A069CU61_WEIOS|nr:excinuclease ABC subunit UvrA [Weissella oryzae]GAK31305.1 thiamine ABC transporter permease [Weissella oryzae SG25]
MTEYIEIIDDRENNLKNISLRIPKKQITVFTGVSGSGKSSLVFDTLANESQRLLGETLPSFVRQFLPKYARPAVEAIRNLPASIVVDQKPLGGNVRSTLATVTDIAPVIRNMYAKLGQPKIGGVDYFSFNTAAGMCPVCQGIGRKTAVNLTKFIDESKSLNEGAVQFPPYKRVDVYTASGLFDNDKPIKDYTARERSQLLDGDATIGKVKMGSFNATYEGFLEKFNRNYLQREGEIPERTQKLISEYTHEERCDSCQGQRFAPKTLAVKVAGYNIAEMLAMQLTDLVTVLDQLAKADKAGIEILQEQVNHLIDLGLGYLTLDRATASLSGGESQRVKLVKYLSNALTDMLYIFDEPSVGLHPDDISRINAIFLKLRDKGNTVIIIEHDPDVIKLADWVIELGPQAGVHGGQVMFEGTYAELLKSDTLTGQYLAQGKKYKDQPRPAKDFLIGLASSVHNLQAQQLKVPVGLLTVLTGVAGSGKSTLLASSFQAAYPELVYVDQNSLASNTRSNPATFIGIMDNIRKLLAKANDQPVGMFSYNSEGACEACGGRGYIESNLAFMETVKTTCEVCGGKRYKQVVLQYKFQEKNIVEILDLTVEEALEFFKKTAAIKKKIQAMNELGLGYLSLGQSTASLSGGEKQRLKLAAEFYQEGSIYVLDEPSTGLHLADIQNLLRIINHFVDNGNTVVVIEHQLDIIRQADWVIDLGPGAGTKGGKVVFAGPVKELLGNQNSVTAQYI